MAVLPDDLEELCTQQLYSPDEPVDTLDYVLSQVSSEDLTRILSDASSSTATTTTTIPSTEQLGLSKPPQRFAPPKSDGEVEAARKNAVPSNTARNTNWAVKVWREWRTNRFQQCNSTLDCPPHLLLCSNSELDYWLSKFVLETRRLDGQPYPPRTLYGIVCSIMRYVRELHPQINFFKDAIFTGFQKTLDGEMKRLRSLGLGVKPKRAEPISVKEESILWERGLLGSHSPLVLLHTMVYLCGLNFALRSGK